jgi:FdhD protein
MFVPLTEMRERAPVISRTVERSGVRDASATPERAEWGIAVEAPVEIALNGVPWTVLLATPADLDDLAVGVALTERVLRDASAVTDVAVSHFLQDTSVNLTVADDGLDMSAVRSRSLLSSTACGLCGLESLAQLQARSHAAAPRNPDGVTDASVLRALAGLTAHQPMNAASHSTHAAAWCTTHGDVLLAREDVGRHNALDKLIGAMARQQLLDADGFLVMSSRCSYELVYKAALTRARALVTISAPTSMALEWSAALSVPLLCTAGDALVRFPMPTAVAGDSDAR